jgi:hypothetical protein
VSLNGLLYSFPDSAPVSPSVPGSAQQTSKQRATSPAQTLAKGVDDSARDSGDMLFEVMARLGIAL